jgi:hypothetical protein
MIFGSMAIINLGGIGLEWLLDVVSRWRSKREAEGTNQFSGDASRFVLIALSVVMFFSAANVFIVNQQFFAPFVLQDRYQEADRILEWLQNNDATPNYVSIPISAGWHLAAADFGQRYFDAWHGYNAFLDFKKTPDIRPVVAKPNYLVLGTGKTPDRPDAVAIKEISNHTVYAIQESLPYGFVVADSILKQVEAGELKHSEVTPLEVTELGPNTFSVQAEVLDENMWIVIMTHYFSGWSVTIDQQAAELTYVGNYLAVEAMSGGHKYVFDYKPNSFRLGFGLTFVSSALLILLLISEVAPQQVRDRFQQVGESAKTFLEKRVMQRIRLRSRKGNGD